MSATQPRQPVCKWCGEKLAEGAEVCPLCRRPASTGQPRPPGPADQRRVQAAAPQAHQRGQTREQEPLAPAPGQEAYGSLANIRQIIRGDRALAAVLALMALQLLLALLYHAWSIATISGLVLWGVLTFRSWGFWMAVGGTGISVAAFVLPLAAALVPGLGILLMPVTDLLLAVLALHGRVFMPLLTALPVNCFVLWVLWKRRDMFD